MNFIKTAQAIGSAIGVQDLIEAVEDLKLDDILGVAGLERRPSALSRLLPAAGLIAISAAVGAGIALLLAPSSGSQLRARLTDGLDATKRRLNETIHQHEPTRTPRHAMS